MNLNMVSPLLRRWRVTVRVESFRASLSYQRTLQKAIWTRLGPSGRGCGCEARPFDAKRLKMAMERKFTRESAKKFGYDATVGNMMLLLEAGKMNKNRHLDAKKRLQLGSIYEEAIRDVVLQEEPFSLLQLTIIKVDVQPSFLEMRVLWMAKGDDSDEVTSEVLKASENLARSRISEILSGAAVPAVKFVPERTHLIQLEMDRLFEKADYGMQYRAVSRTGAVLGSMSDSGTVAPDKEERKKESNASAWIIKKINFKKQFEANRIDNNNCETVRESSFEPEEMVSEPSSEPT